MNLKNKVGDRIIKTLENQSIKNRDLLDEMSDHYLSSLEDKLSQGMSEHEALLRVEQEIHHGDLTMLSDKVHASHHLFYWMLGVLSFLIISFFIFKKMTTTHVFALSSTAAAQESCLTFWPLDTALYDITADFGERLHPILKITQHHSGIDLKAPHGTGVLAVFDAVVLEAGMSDAAGKHVTLAHSGSLYSKHYHLSEILVQNGQKVQAGELIGRVGSTGASTGPHLHFELLEGDQPVDPRAYLSP